MENGCGWEGEERRGTCSRTINEFSDYEVNFRPWSYLWLEKRCDYRTLCVVTVFGRLSGRWPFHIAIANLLEKLFFFQTTAIVSYSWKCGCYSWRWQWVSQRRCAHRLPSWEFSTACHFRYHLASFPNCSDSGTNKYIQKTWGEVLLFELLCRTQNRWGTVINSQCKSMCLVMATKRTMHRDVPRWSEQQLQVKSYDAKSIFTEQHRWALPQLQNKNKKHSKYCSSLHDKDYHWGGSELIATKLKPCGNSSCAQGNINL